MTERWPRPEGRDEDPIAPLDKDHVDSVLERLREHRATSSRHVEGRVLGEGGMGIVLEVRDADLRRPLALKRLHPKRQAKGDPELGRHYLARFLQEAQVTGQLGHPGIPPVHELSIDEQGPYFTMPVIRGHNLDEVFAKARAGSDGWSTARALAILLKVCEAMAFAHAKRVVHRDLKPENVRIGRFGEVYVMDWGLARVIGRGEIDLVRWSQTGALSSVHTDREDSDGDANAVLQTLDGDVIGTPYYMAPEQARGELAQVGPRSDVYAVGGMLYLLLTGRAPYQPAEGRISPRTVLAAVLHGPPPSVVSIAPEADADLVAICEKAMARDVEARYAGMEELASDIEAWIDRRPIQASAPSVRHALRLFAERHRAAVATAAAGALLLIGAGTWFVLTVTQERDAKETARFETQQRGDAMAVSALQTQAGDFWPSTPARVEEMNRWLTVVADLEKRLVGYRAMLSQRTLPDDRRAELEDLLTKADTLLGLRVAVMDRMTTGRRLLRLSNEESRTSWDEAISDIGASARYGHLRLKSQPGLVPLGKNPHSGLWEFWHVSSGDRPAGTSIRAEDGITLVLLPATRWAYGVPDQAVKWQPGDRTDSVDIPPFFCGKFEVTQAQWLRVMEDRPSRWQPTVTAGAPECPLCPVESISWNESAKFAARLDLVLLPEYWWEYACQTSADTPVFVFGADDSALQDSENIRDRTLGSTASMPAAPWTDHYSQSAPIGSFRPNPFGLHDMLGNVAEWCADPIVQGRLRGPDELVVVDVRSFRGGSWYQAPQNCYSRLRQWDTARGLNHARGLRVGRRVDPADSDRR